MADNVITQALCGESGVFTRLKDFQTEINEYVAKGKNFINSVEATITQIENFIDTIEDFPEKIVSLLQQEVFNILSKVALEDSEGAISDLLELRAKYQEAGPAVERILDNLERFIDDPLNTPLDVCNDIPNLVQIGETFVEFPKKALQADPGKEIENIKETIVKEYERIFDNPSTRSEKSLDEEPEQTVRTIPKYPTPDVMNDIIISGRVPIDQAYSLAPGSAHKAAIAHAQSNSAVTSSINKSTPPNIPSISNPYPEGEQFVASDFTGSKNAKNIASKINSLHPSVRKNYAEGIKTFLTNNPDFDVNISEAYRSPYGSPNITGGLTPIQISAVKALQEKGINDPTAISNILAQIQAESGFRPRSENLGGYSAQTLYNFYGAEQTRNKVRFNSIGEAQALKARGPEAIGNLLYGGRLGNGPNEGFKYRGRGLIQLTGKYNYGLYGKKIGVDLVANPDLANDPAIASKIAVEYFLSKQSSGTNLRDINSVGSAVGYAGGQSETDKRAQIAKTFLAKLEQNGYDSLPAGDSWHNFGAAADIIVYENSKSIPPEVNSSVYLTELRSAMSSQGLSNDRTAELSHFYLSSLGSEVPEDLRTGKIAFNDYIGGANTSFASAPEPTTGQRVVTYDISSIQREARNTAISQALAEGKSPAEAESIGEEVGNIAGADAFRNIT